VELIQLHSFYQIVKTGSFKEASEMVFRSQSAVSHQIKKLEKELKVKLFKRIGKRVRLTQEGEILFESTKKILQSLENLKKIYTDMNNGFGGRLIIAATSAVLSYILPNTIKKFVDLFSKINFKLITCRFVPEIISLVLVGEVDLAISVKPYQELPPQILFLPWRSFNRILIVAKEHPLSKNKEINKLANIVKYPHILQGKGSVNRKVIDEVYARSKLVPNVIMEVDFVEDIKSYVEMGIGVGIISSLSISQKDRERFNIFNISRLFGKVEFGIYYRKDIYISIAMKQFIKLFAPNLLKEGNELGDKKRVSWAGGVFVGG